VHLGLAEPWPDGCFKHADHQQQAHRILPLTSPQTNSNQSNQTIKPWSRMARSQINAADPQTIKASRHQWPCVHGSGHPVPSICNSFQPAGNTSRQDEDNVSIVSPWSLHQSCSESHLRLSSTGLSHHKTEPSSQGTGKVSIEPTTRAPGRASEQGNGERHSPVSQHSTSSYLKSHLLSCMSRTGTASTAGAPIAEPKQGSGSEAFESDAIRSKSRETSPSRQKERKSSQKEKRQRQRSNIEK